jgi:hypothetical protein
MMMIIIVCMLLFILYFVCQFCISIICEYRIRHTDVLWNRVSGLCLRWSLVMADRRLWGWFMTIGSYLCCGTDRLDICCLFHCHWGRDGGPYTFHRVNGTCSPLPLITTVHLQFFCALLLKHFYYGNHSYIPYMSVHVSTNRHLCIRQEFFLELLGKFHLFKN